MSGVPTKFVGESFEKIFEGDMPILSEVKFYYGPTPGAKAEGLLMTEKDGKVRNFKLTKYDQPKLEPEPSGM